MSVETLSKNKAIVSRWISEVFNKKNLSAIDELKFNSYLDWTPHPSQRMDLPVSGLKQSLPEFLASFPDFHYTADELMAEGDLVVCLGRWRGTHEGGYMGVAPSGARLTGSRMDIFRISGDKMVEHWGCGGELGFLRMMGLLANKRPAGPAAHGNKEVARRFVEEVVNRRDLAAMDELVDDRAVDHTNQSLSMFFILRAVPDFRVEVEEVLAEDDKVTVIGRFTGTHTGQYGGAAPTGREVSGSWVNVLRLDGGRVVESWHDWDDSGLTGRAAA